MRFARKRIGMRRHKTFEMEDNGCIYDVAMAYAASSSYDEFKVKADLEVKDVSLLLKIACWAQWMSEKHRFAWFAVKTCIVLMSPISVILCDFLPWIEKSTTASLILLSCNVSATLVFFIYYWKLVPVMDLIESMRQDVEDNNA